MKPKLTLALAGKTHEALKRHLFPGDGKEAAAIMVCTSAPGPRDRLLVRETILVPHEACQIRATDRIVWPGAFIEQAIDMAEPESLTIFLLHSHPGGWLAFSSVDDISDAAAMPSLLAALGNRHGSAIMTPDGAIRARLYSSDMTISPVDLVTVAGNDIHFWWSDSISNGTLPKRPMAFTSDMQLELARLSFAVIGVSGIGSIDAEQLARLGAGELKLIDFDLVEPKNLNRILNSSLKDAQEVRSKVEMFATAIALYRGPGVAVPVPYSINSREAVLAASQCDVIFCCVDTQEARQVADLIAAAFLIPLFDAGVVIPTRDTDAGPAIADVFGRIDYVQPGGATLADRGVYSPEGLRDEYVRMVNPEAFRNELAEGYIKGVIEEAPSVISLNMRTGAAAVMEYIARAYPFRHAPNRLYARTYFSSAACEEDYFNEDDFSCANNDVLGRGDAEPLLGLPSLRAPRKAMA